jgi:hypothetical protein
VITTSRRKLALHAQRRFAEEEPSPLHRQGVAPNPDIEQAPTRGSGGLSAVGWGLCRRFVSEKQAG